MEVDDYDCEVRDTVESSFDVGKQAGANVDMIDRLMEQMNADDDPSMIMAEYEDDEEYSMI